MDVNVQEEGRLHTEVKRQQVSLLYEALPRSLMAGTVVALALCYVQLDVVGQARVIVWLSIFLLATLVRFLVWQWFRGKKDDDIDRLDQILMVGALVSGLVWGSGGILLYSEASREHQLFLAFALAGMAAGSVAVLSYRRLQAWGFITLALLPITLQWIVAGDAMSVAQAVMTLAFATVLVSMASVTSRHSVLALTAEFGAEEAARSAARDRDFLRLLLDTIPARVFWKDRNSHYLGGNELFAQDAGLFSEDELVGKSDEDLRWKNRAADFRDTDEKVMESGQPMLRFEEKAIRSDNEVYWREVSKAPIRDPDGEVIGVLGTYHDITEKLEIEAQLRQAQKMEAVGTLVAGIAHEFNNMLAGITGNLFLAKNRIKSGDPELALAKLEVADHSAFKAAKMIRQLMTLSRKDQTFLNLEHVDLSKWIHEAIDLPKATVPANIALAVKCEEQPLVVSVDVTLLLQILVNLINNACDASVNRTRPEIRIALGAVPVKPEFLRRHPGFTATECVKLTVSDNGAGIPASRLSRIFEPFYTTKEVGKGTGLGLSIVQGAMQSLHGCVEVESRLGQGSTFNLFFPRLDEATTESTVRAEQAVPVPRGHGETILVADDEPEVLSIISEILASLGYQVLTAEDGEQALAIFEQKPGVVDLVLLDIIMPNMLGTTAAKEIRARRPDIPLAFCTGYSQEEIGDELKDVGNFRLIGKPFQVVEIGRVIHALLHGI